MATIADKLSAIIGQKSDMVKNLNIKGVSSASDSEKFNTLVAKVLTVGGKNPYVKPGTGNTSSPTLNQKLGALYSQKNLLATYLTSMGVPASTSEKLNTLVPKILEIPIGEMLCLLGRDAVYLPFSSILYSMPLSNSILTMYEIKSLFTGWIPLSSNYNGYGMKIDDKTCYITALYNMALRTQKISVSGKLFYTNDYIEEINFPNCTGIYYEACMGLYKLKYAYFNNDLSFIGSSAFYGCGNLIKISKHETYEYNKMYSIGERAFYSCGHLKGYFFTNNLVTIGDCAFYGCTDLYGIILSKLTCINSSTFAGTASLAWFGFSKYSLILSKCSVIYRDAFRHYKYNKPYAYTGIRYLSAEECLTIHDYAFNNCLSLSNIYLPKVKRIGVGAFYCNPLDLHTLTSYEWNSAVEPLSCINIPNCEYIASYAFWGCELHSDCHLENVTFIGQSAFKPPTSGNSPLIKYFNDNDDVTVFLNYSCSIENDAFQYQPITEFKLVGIPESYSLNINSEAFRVFHGLKKFSYFRNITNCNGHAYPYILLHPSFSDDIHLERLSHVVGGAVIDVNASSANFNLFIYGGQAYDTAKIFLKKVASSKYLYLKGASLYETYMSNFIKYESYTSEYLSKHVKQF